jgi:hypothetical protein
MFLGLDGTSGRNDSGAATPLENSLLPFLSYFNSQLLHSGFFTGNDVKDWIASADQGFNVMLEIHPMDSLVP